MALNIDAPDGLTADLAREAAAEVRANRPAQLLAESVNPSIWEAARAGFCGSTWFYNQEDKLHIPAVVADLERRGFRVKAFEALHVEISWPEEETK